MRARGGRFRLFAVRACMQLFLCALVVTAPRAARAAYPGTCQTTDCDGDGKNNFVDGCPSGHSQALQPACSTATCPAPNVCYKDQCASPCSVAVEFPCAFFDACCIGAGEVTSSGCTAAAGPCLCVQPGTCSPIVDGGTGGTGGPTDPEQSFAGFQDIGCYDTLVPPTPGCIPVAARRFDEIVPARALTPSTSTGLHRIGFTYVGVFDPNTSATIGTAAAALAQASASDVRTGFLSVNGVPKNALFACMGGVELASDGTVLNVTPTVYGFRAVANYVRAIEEAGRPEGQAALENFSDGMGLLRGQQNFPPAFRAVLKGWNGQIYDSSRWSTALTSLTGASGSDLPKALSTYVDRDCYRDSFVPPLQIGPFGPEVIVLNGQLPKADACTRQFPDGGSALVFTDFSFAVGELRDSSVLRSWRDYFQTAPLDERNAGLFGVTVSDDGPVAFPRAVDEFTLMTANDIHYSWRSPPTWLLTQVRPPTPPPYHAIMLPPGFSSSLPDGAYLGSPPGSATGDWLVLTTGAFDAVHAVDMALDPPLLIPDKGSGNAPFDVTHLFVSAGWSVQNQRYDATTGTWSQDFLTWEGRPDEITSSMTTIEDGFGFEATQDETAILSVHHRGSKFFPGGDEWRTNAPGGSSCSLSSQTFSIGHVGSVTGNTIADAWCEDKIPPELLADNTPITSYEARVNLCTGYHPSNPDEHWPGLAARVPFAALFGQPGKVAAGLSGTDLVRAQAFAPRLHEGEDYNWTFHPPSIAPGYDLTGDHPPDFCFGTEPVPNATPIEFPISCSNATVLHCGADADCDSGCSPFNIPRFFTDWIDEIKQQCQVSCDSCGSSDNLFAELGDLVCDFTSCTAEVLDSGIKCGDALANGAAEQLLDRTLYWFDFICVGLTGANCTDFMSLHHCPFPDDKVEEEHELEYNLAFGGQDFGLGYTSDCNTLNCDEDGYIHANKLQSVSGTVRVDTDTNGRAIGSFNDSLSLQSEKIWPFTFGLGLFNRPEGVWGRVASNAGEIPDALVPNDVHPFGVLPDFIRTAIDEKIPSPLVAAGFRVEFLGDLITDCGHNPLHQEMHPPNALLLHATTGGLAGLVASRYSLFAWRRVFADFDQDIVFDLWPPLRLKAASALAGKNLFQKSGRLNTGLVIGTTGTAGATGNISCVPFPDVAPTHFRCTLSKGGDTIPPEGNCSDNPRFLPSCATDIAGGLAEVSWQ